MTTRVRSSIYHDIFQNIEIMFSGDNFSLTLMIKVQGIERSIAMQLQVKHFYFRKMFTVENPSYFAPLVKYEKQ